MADYIKLAVAAVLAQLQARTPELLASRAAACESPDVAALVVPFADWGVADTGVMPNPPKAWVVPGHNSIGDEGQALSQRATLTILMGISGTDPEALVWAAMEYVGAVTDAIEAAPPEEWGANITHVHPGEQDFGARFKQGQGFAIFPAVTVSVEFYELPVEESA